MAARAPRLPWFQALGGLSFKCTACGKCCSKTSGIVRVNPAEIEAIAELKKMSTEDFTQGFIRVLDNNKLALKNNETDTACIFLNEKKQCSIYEARPTQCRTFPFWPELVVSPFDWQVAATECEGISADPLTKENLIPPETIVEEMLIHTVHGEEDAVETTYSFGKELVQEIDPTLVDSFREEFFDTHHRTVVYEDADALVLDTVTPDVPVRRSLVLKDNITHTQTEMNFFPDSDVNDKHVWKMFDYSTLVLPVHQAMMCIPSVLQGSVHVLGAGGGALPMYMKNLVPDLDVVVVDRSPNVLTLAQEYFGLSNVKMITSSAETHLRSVRGAARVILDIGSYWTEDALPLLSTLSTDSLRATDGMLIVNVVLPPGDLSAAGRKHGLRWLEQLERIAPHVVVLVLNQNAVFYCSLTQPADHLLTLERKNQRERWGSVFNSEDFRAQCTG